MAERLSILWIYIRDHKCRKGGIKKGGQCLWLKTGIRLLDYGEQKRGMNILMNGGEKTETNGLENETQFFATWKK